MNILATVYRDPSYHTFYDIARTVEIPAFVKEASTDDADLSVAHNDSFGDPGTRKYPLNNKSNTWLSRQYFEREKVRYDQKTAALIEERINKAANFWNLPGANRIQQEPARKHTLTIYDQAKKLFEVNIEEPGHYKQAAEYLESHKANIPYESRRAFARELLATPDELKTTLREHTQDYIEKAAGFGMATGSRMTYAIMSRVANCADTHTELSSRLVKMGSLVDDQPVTPSLLHKVAVMLDHVDRATGLVNYYGRGIDSPEECLFPMLQKHAEEMRDNAVLLSTGTVMSRHELTMAKEAVDQFFDNHIGEIPYSSNEEMIEQVAALPRPDAEVLEKILEG
jgi:hypothetical protein